MSVDRRGHISYCLCLLSCFDVFDICATMFNALDDYCFLAAKAQKIPRYHGYIVLMPVWFDSCGTRSLMEAQLFNKGRKVSRIGRNLLVVSVNRGGLAMGGMC